MKKMLTRLFFCQANSSALFLLARVLLVHKAAFLISDYDTGKMLFIDGKLLLYVSFIDILPYFTEKALCETGLCVWSQDKWL